MYVLWVWGHFGVPIPCNHLHITLLGGEWNPHAVFTPLLCISNYRSSSSRTICAALFYVIENVPMLENQLKTKTLWWSWVVAYSLYILVSHPICIHQTLIPKIDKMVELFNHLSPEIEGEITFLHTNCYINSSIVLISHRIGMVHLSEPAIDFGEF